MGHPIETVFYISDINALVRGEDALRKVLGEHSNRGRTFDVQQYGYKGMKKFRTKKVVRTDWQLQEEVA